MSLTDDITVIKQLVGGNFTPAIDAFYKSYTFRVKVIPKHVGLTAYTQRSIYTKSNNTRAVIDSLNNLLTYITKHLANANQLLEIKQYIDAIDNCKSSIHADCYFIYFKDSADVIGFITQFNESIACVIGPTCNEHGKIMTKQNNIIVRDTLYYNKYRFSLHVAISDNVFGNEVQCMIKNINGSVRILGAWVFNRFADQQRRWRHNTRYNYNNNAIIYFTNLSDFIFIKLQIGDNVTKSCEIKLTSELA